MILATKLKKNLTILRKKHLKWNHSDKRHEGAAQKIKMSIKQEFQKKGANGETVKK